MSKIGQLLHRFFPGRSIDRSEAALNAVSIIAAGVGPEHDRRGGMVKLAADHDLVAGALERLADFGGVESDRE
jgi:hypothetical protein